MPRENNPSFSLKALDKKVGLRLSAERQQKNLSQKALAALAGISHSTVAHLEQGRQRPLPGTLRSLARALSVPLDVLAPDWETAEDFRPKSGVAHPGVGLRILRRQKGLTLAALAIETGQSISNLSRLERGLHATRKITELNGPGASYLGQLSLIDDNLAKALGFANAKALTIACAAVVD